MERLINDAGGLRAVTNTDVDQCIDLAICRYRIYAKKIWMFVYNI